MWYGRDRLWNCEAGEFAEEMADGRESIARIMIPSFSFLFAMVSIEDAFLSCRLVLVTSGVRFPMECDTAFSRMSLRQFRVRI